MSFKLPLYSAETLSRQAEIHCQCLTLQFQQKWPRLAPNLMGLHVLMPKLSKFLNNFAGKQTDRQTIDTDHLSLPLLSPWQEK